MPGMIQSCKEGRPASCKRRFNGCGAGTLKSPQQWAAVPTPQIKLIFFHLENGALCVVHNTYIRLGMRVDSANEERNVLSFTDGTWWIVVLHGKQMSSKVIDCWLLSRCCLHGRAKKSLYALFGNAGGTTAATPNNCGKAGERQCLLPYNLT